MASEYRFMRTMKPQVRILFPVLVLFIPEVAPAWPGKCVGVSDGDTISVMDKGVCLQGRLDKLGKKLVCTKALVWAIVCSVQIVLSPSFEGQSFLLSSSL